MYVCVCVCVYIFVIFEFIEYMIIKTNIKDGCVSSERLEIVINF